MTYHKLKNDLQEIIGILCQYKSMKIVEGYLMPDYVHLLLMISHIKE